MNNISDKVQNLIKHTILLIIIGIIIGLVCFIFGKTLQVLSNFSFILFPYNLLLLPLVGISIVYLKKKYNENVNASMLQVFDSTQKSKKLSLIIIPFQIITTWFSHLAGASVGREGVALQLGATISNNMAFKFNADSKTLTSAGKAAGFSALFGTPLAGIFFAYEMNNKKIKDYKFWCFAIIMSFTALYTTTILGLNHFHQVVELNIESFINIGFIIKFLVFILIIILCGNLFVILLQKQRTLYTKIFPNEYKKILLLSIVFIILMCFAKGRYMSLGTNLIHMSFDGPQNIIYFDFLLKLLFTTFIISIGFQGGEVTPLFSIGATLGIVIGSLLNLPIALLAGLGYSYMFGHATNAFIASFFICIEVFGIKMLPFALILLVLSIPFKNKNSIYPLYS